MEREFGVRVFAFASLALGLVGLWWGDFTSFWQPVPDETPGRTALAYAAAILFIIGGGGLQWRRTVRPAAIVLTLLYLAFTLLWSRRIIGFPHLIGTWSGTAEQLVLALGGVLAYVLAEEAPLRTRVIAGLRITFGLCLISFGLAHFGALPQTAGLVPPWIPLGQTFWAMATGVCHIAAGLALVANILPLLAARLLTLMFLGFELLVWIPKFFQAPTEHNVWAGNAINLALLGAAWALTDALFRYRSPAEEGEGATQPARGGGSPALG